MSFVAIAVIGGAAAIGSGTSIYGGIQQKKAATKAAHAQRDAMNLAIQEQRSGETQALSYLDPYRQYGLNAGSTLQSLLYSPGQLQGQQESELARLQGEIANLKKKELSFQDFDTKYHLQYRGKKSRTRLRAAHSAYSNDLQQKIMDAEANLSQFQQQAEIQAKQAAQGGPEIEASPWYQFQADLLNRSQDRAFAARGLTGSGFEAEERRRGLIELGAGETERQFSRLFNMYGTGANASNVGAGIITGTAQNVGNLQVGQGQAQAQGYLGEAAAKSNMATGIANSVTGAVGTGLNYYQFQNLINANTPKTGTPQESPTQQRYGNNINAYGNPDDLAKWGSTAPSWNPNRSTVWPLG